MKVLILGFGKIAYMPYMHFYLEQLRNNNCEIHLLYWDRDGKPDASVSSNIKSYKYEKYQEDDASMINKAINFYGYRKMAKKILNSEKFDFIVVLHSLPGFILNDILTKEYKGKYILDYRDYTYEHIAMFRNIIAKIVNESNATFVSSDAFRENLPLCEKIYTSHNLDKSLLENRFVRKNDNRNIPVIRIRFWGFIRYEQLNKTIIDNFANDSRFELHYHGREQTTARILKRYCVEKDIKNVFFHGEYKPEERYRFAAETDFVHNMYENDKRTIGAMGNKYYDSVAMYIPQICTKGSFMGKQVSEYEIGLECDPYNEAIADKIYQYYRSIEWDRYETNCDSALYEIVSQIDKSQIVINNILN